MLPFSIRNTDTGASKKTTVCRNRYRTCVVHPHQLTFQPAGSFLDCDKKKPGTKTPHSRILLRPSGRCIHSTRPKRLGPTKTECRHEFGQRLYDHTIKPLTEMHSYVFEYEYTRMHGGSEVLPTRLDEPVGQRCCRLHWNFVSRRQRRADSKRGERARSPRRFFMHITCVSYLCVYVLFEANAKNGTQPQQARTTRIGIAKAQALQLFRYLYRTTAVDHSPHSLLDRHTHSNRDISRRPVVIHQTTTCTTLKKKKKKEKSPSL